MSGNPYDVVTTPGSASYGAPVLDWNSFFNPQKKQQQPQQPQQNTQPQPGSFLDKLKSFLNSPNGPAGPTAPSQGATLVQSAVPNAQPPMYGNNAPSPLDNAQWPAGPAGARFINSQGGGLY